MTLLWSLLIGFLLMLSAFFAMAETSLVGLSKIRLRHMVHREMKGALGLQQLLARMDDVIASIVLANNFVNTAISSLGAALCIAWLGPEWGIPAATLIMGSAIILFGEITPKVFGLRHADRVALRVAPIMRVLILVLGPFSRRFMALSNSFLQFLGVEPKPRSPLITEEEIKLMIEVGRKEGVLGEHERTLLHRIFEFGDLQVSEVLIPLQEMIAVPEEAGHDEILRVLTEEGHSRIPVYRGSPEQVIGIIYAQEMLHLWKKDAVIVLQDLIHPPLTVPPERRVHELLQEFQRRRIQIAIVVNEQGKAIGLVTLEDLIEEIVGEIEEGEG
jgi:putative hemolysin